MARAIADIQKDIRALASDERAELLRALIAELDAPADADAEKAWLAEALRGSGDFPPRRIPSLRRLWCQTRRRPSAS